MRALFTYLAVLLSASATATQQPIKTYNGYLDWVFWNIDFVGDLDGDGHDEFVIVSRFGKPQFDNDEGVGRGEAYVVYAGSGPDRLRGEFNLNSVGETLPGATLLGISANRANGRQVTDGITNVTLIPDADDDGKG